MDNLYRESPISLSRGVYFKVHLNNMQISFSMYQYTPENYNFFPNNFEYMDPTPCLVKLVKKYKG
jgi:hypothetical protein